MRLNQLRAQDAAQCSAIAHSPSSQIRVPTTSMQAIVHKRDKTRTTILNFDSFMEQVPQSAAGMRIGISLCKHPAGSVHCSLESLNSSHSSGKRNSTRDCNYNVNILRDLKRSGQKPLAHEIRDVRRECQHFYTDQASVENRRSTIKDALEQIDELEKSLNDPDCDVLFISELHAFICWVYTKIRFGNFATNMAQNFHEFKNHQIRILNALKGRGVKVQRLLALLRFSQLCLEYAEVCDSESLKLCRMALDEASEYKARSESQLSDTDSMKSKESEKREREEKRIREIAEMLRSNITQIELTCTLRMQGETKYEKLI